MNEFKEILWMIFVIFMFVMLLAIKNSRTSNATTAASTFVLIIFVAAGLTIFITEVMT